MWGLVLCAVTTAWWAAAAAADAVPDLPIRPELTGYEQTSSHEEVLNFVRQVCAVSSQLHPTTFGYSSQGRALPVVVWDRDGDGEPSSVRAANRTRVLLVANVHAGEVCGKEALLQLLRSLARGEHRAWGDSLVVLIAPIYNADGNERLTLERAGQYGPFGGMGQRSNAQGLDLNRDYMKLDTPEAWSLARLWRQYDPHVAVDFHTTDGTYMAYHLSYSPPLHPFTYGPVVELLRGQLLPWVTEQVRANHGWHYYYYGNLPPPYAGNLAWTDLDTTKGWYTFDHRARYSNNYWGLRNRIGILSEAYSYATFEERIRASRLFAEYILQFAHDHAGAIRRLCAAADSHSVVGEAVPLSATHVRSPRPVTILLGEVSAERHPYSGGTVLLRRDVVRPVELYEYGTFAPVEVVPAPREYLVPPELDRAVALLEAHGISYQPLTVAQAAEVERFRIDSCRVAEATYEGHQAVTLHGEYVRATEQIPAGTLVVPVAQPLGRLACYLLEPRSDDGLANWNLLGDSLASAPYYPIGRVPADR